MAPNRFSKRSRRLLALVVCVSSLLARALPADPAIPSFVIKDEKDLSYETLVRLIQERDVRSIEELLPLLPEKFRRGYTLVNSSRSTLQGASRASPRAVVYGQTGRFILTFNGSSKQAGGNAIEIMETEPFKLHEIEFPKKRRSLEKVRFSEPNPAKCTGCHGNPPRPLWDNYPVWPGVYGVVHKINPGTKDDDSYRAFVKSVKTNPRSRYASLVNLGTVKKLENDYSFIELEKLPKGKSYLLQEPGMGDSGSQPSDLSKLLLWYNYQRIFSELKASPKYDRIKYALTAAVGRCPLNEPITGFLPPAINDGMKARGRALETVEVETAEAITRYLGTKHKRIKVDDYKATDEGYSKSEQWEYEAQFLIPARYVLLSQDLSMDEWAMTKETKTYTLGTDQGNVDMLGYLLSQDLSKDLPELAKCGKPREGLSFGGETIGADWRIDSESRQSCCALLKEKSLAALASIPAASPAMDPDCLPMHQLGTQPKAPDSVSTGMKAGQKLLQAPKAFESCVSCHTGNAPIGPPFHFDDPKLFQKELNTGLMKRIKKSLHEKNESKRMPQGRDISHDEIKDLEDYLDAVSKQP